MPTMEIIKIKIKIIIKKKKKKNQYQLLKKSQILPAIPIKLEKILDDINTLNRKVGKVCNEHEQIFNLDYRRNVNESQILTKMLIQENKLIYKKIKFTKSFERMIKNIKYIEKYNSKAVLSYFSIQFV